MSRRSKNADTTPADDGREPQAPEYDHPADDPDYELALGDRVQRSLGLPVKNTQEG